MELADAASRALANAHSTVRKANLLPGGQRRSELGLVGMTICLSDGAEMVIALASPAQAFVLQDAEIFPVPALSIQARLTPSNHVPSHHCPSVERASNLRSM